MNLLVTGASGFVGSFLCPYLLSKGWKVRGTLLPSEAPSCLSSGVEPVTVEPLGPGTDWSHALAGIDTVIHLAARVHIMDDPSANHLDEFRKVNVKGTEQLGRMAAKAGVERFVFISSIKVNGEESPIAYNETSPVKPTDPYGISKWEAEQALRRIEAETGMEVVILRPALVYGPGVKANFLNMMKAVHRGIPLPFASVVNKRSLIYAGNLADAVAACVQHPAAAGKSYLISDGEDLSTPGLIRMTADALGVPARLFPFPLPVIILAAGLIGKSAAISRLTGSLAVDSSRIRKDLGWQPPFAMSEGLKETASWYLAAEGRQQ